jgi:hypothetical protein
MLSKDDEQAKEGIPDFGAACGFSYAVWSSRRFRVTPCIGGARIGRSVAEYWVKSLI